MGTKINSLFKSRRFWVAVAGVVVVSSETVRANIGITADRTCLLDCRRLFESY